MNTFLSQTRGSVGPAHAILLVVALLPLAGWTGVGQSLAAAIGGAAGSGSAKTGAGAMTGGEPALSSEAAIAARAGRALRAPSTWVGHAKRGIGQSLQYAALGLEGTAQALKGGARLLGPGADGVPGGVHVSRGIALSPEHVARAERAGIRIHGAEPRFVGDRVRVASLDLEVDGVRFRHEGVVTNDSAGMVVYDPDEDAVLVLRRQRLMVGDEGYEFPAGGVDPGEEPRAAAIRELVEETGYEPLDVRELAVASAAGNSSTRQFHIYGARGARKVGEPVDLHEAAGLRWMPRSELQDALMAGEFREAASLLAGLMADASGLFDPI